MRILPLIALAAFLIFGVLPGQGMAAGMDHGTDCVACDVDMDHATGHGQCSLMTTCGLATLPDMPELLAEVTLAETRLALPVVIAVQGVCPSCDLPPPRG